MIEHRAIELGIRLLAVGHQQEETDGAHHTAQQAAALAVANDGYAVGLLSIRHDIEAQETGESIIEGWLLPVLGASLHQVEDGVYLLLIASMDVVGQYLHI